MKKTLCALAVICTLMILPITVPVPTISVDTQAGVEQLFQSKTTATQVNFDLQFTELKLVAEAAAWGPDCEDGIFEGGWDCILDMIAQIVMWVDPDHWFD